MKLLGTLFLTLAALSCSAEESEIPLKFSNASFADAAGWKAESAPDERSIYGDQNASQFGDLRIPEGDAPVSGYPVIVFIHGGAWLSDWTKNYSEAFVEKLAQNGFATWDMEYRRMGNRGGGYPGTFEDIADGADHLRTLAESHPLDLSRVVAVGHSSGGHLALWLAGRKNLPESSPLYRAEPLALSAVISIAGVNDLELSYTLGDREDVLRLSGVDSMATGAERFKETNPARLLPFGIPQSLMIGEKDAQWRLEMTGQYADKSNAAGDITTVTVIPIANHVDVADARSGFATCIAQEARNLLDH